MLSKEQKQDVGHFHMFCNNLETDEDRAAVLAAVVENSVNTMSDTVSQVAAYNIGRHAHRTLQQNVMRFVHFYIKEMSRPDKEFDMRNEASVKFARHVRDAVDTYPLPTV